MLAGARSGARVRIETVIVCIETVIVCIDTVVIVCIDTVIVCIDNAAVFPRVGCQWTRTPTSALRQAGVGTNEMPESARFYGELAAVINHEQYESKRHSNFESLHPHYAADDTGEQGCALTRQCLLLLCLPTAALYILHHGLLTITNAHNAHRDEYEPPSTFKFEEIRPPSKSKTKKHEPTPAAPVRD